MNVIAVNYNVGKRRGVCPRQQWLLYTSRYAWEKMKEERSKILWNKITNCWNLQEAVNFEYRRRMPTVSPMCHESGTEPWQSKTATIAATTNNNNNNNKTTLQQQL